MSRQDAKSAKEDAKRRQNPWFEGIIPSSPCYRLLGVFLGVLGVLAALSDEGALSPATHAASPARFTYVGAPSCAAAGCHNGNDLGHVVGSEYSVWSARDPHARAFAVLDGKRSRDIMKLRGGGDARKDPGCLACHALPGDIEHTEAPTADLQAEGVSCEACHGPASAWRDEHYTAEWRRLSPGDQEKKGFFPTRDLARRSETCARCHVGLPGAAVDHDLIAEGHPRLTFEYAAYDALLPHHWDHERLPRTGNDGKEMDYGADFPARAWEIGQLTAARQAAILASSHKPEGSEFADLNCFACHHDLGHTDWRRKRLATGKPALPERASWYTAGPSFLNNGGLDPEVKRSDDLSDWAKRLQDAAVAAGRKGVTAPPEAIEALLLRVTKPDADDAGPSDWDHAAQTYLAAAALSRALAAVDCDAPPVRPEVVRCLRNAVAFPPPRDDERFDSPRDFSPMKFRDLLRDYRSSFGK